MKYARVERNDFSIQIANVTFLTGIYFVAAVPLCPFVYVNTAKF